MATYYANNATLISNTNPPAKAGVGEQGGVVRLIYDKYSYTADLGTDTILFGGLIPKGARVIDFMVKFADLGSAGIADFGWAASADAVEAGDQDGFAAAVDMNNAADIVKMSDNLTGTTATGMGKKFAAACQMQMVLTTGSTATTGDVEVFLTYVID